MHLSRLFIRGFRSIAELDLTFAPGKNIIIGRNNAGKSNIIRALDLVLGEAAPAWARSENITDADYHSYRSTENGQSTDHVANEIAIWCQLERDANEELDWQEINKCFGFNFHGTKVRNATGVPKRLQLTNLSAEFQNIFALNEDEVDWDKVWVDSKLKNQNTFRQHLANKFQFVYAFLATRTDKGIIKQLRFLFREGESEDWVLCFRASVRTELLQSAILPSIRDPAFQLRLTPWSWFGKLMKHLTKDCAGEAELNDALTQLRTAGNKVFAEVTAKVENDALSISFPDARLSFQFSADKKTDLYKSCVVYIDDGFKSLLIDKGTGIQSATVLGLFSYYTKFVNTTGSALLCVEEPELYLHPHARRVISNRLDEFLDSNRNQVIATTHGVEFIRTTTETFNLLLVRKMEGEGTTIRVLDARAFLDLLVNNNQNELFFSDGVIVCEGLDEYVLRAAAEELYPGELDRRNISIVATEGKDRIVKMANLLLSLDISCSIFADFDFLLRDTIKPSTYNTKAHPSVADLPTTFFSQAHVFGARGEPVQRLIVALRNRLRTQEPQVFYEGKQASEFGDPALLRSLKRLRNAGIGILDGEIEDLSKDNAWLDPNTGKFSLRHVYRLREHLNSGRKMSELFDLSPLAEFLTPILNA